MRTSSKTSTKGFTLIEVVVSLAVLSLILLATVSALRTFANTQVSLDKMMTRVDEVRTVSGFLRDILEGGATGGQAAGGLSMGSSGSSLAYFKGTGESLELKAPILFGEVYGGTYLLRVAREGPYLKLYWQEPPPRNTPVVWNDQNSRILVNEIEEFHISYRAEFGLGWRDGGWDSAGTDGGAPALVRLGIKAAGRYWPDLILKVQR